MRPRRRKLEALGALLLAALVTLGLVLWESEEAAVERHARHALHALEQASSSSKADRASVLSKSLTPLSAEDIELISRDFSERHRGAAAIAARGAELIHRCEHVRAEFVDVVTVEISGEQARLQGEVNVACQLEAPGQGLEQQQRRVVFMFVKSSHRWVLTRVEIARRVDVEPEARP